MHPKAPRTPEHLGVDVAKLPFEDACATEVLAVHILEHFYEWEVPGVLSEWKRVLKPGGKLIMEMPDIFKAARNLLEGQSDMWAMWPMYGDNTLKDPLMCHKWGWSYKTLSPLLKELGFTSVERPTEWHGRKQGRDFRVEAIRC